VRVWSRSPLSASQSVSVLSSPAAAIRAASGLTATACTALSGSSSATSSVRPVASQTPIVLTSAQTTREPSGAKQQWPLGRGRPLTVWISSPRSASHSVNLRSVDAISAPLGLIAQPSTGRSPTVRVWSRCPLPASQMRIVPSAPAETIRSPSGVKVQAVMATTPPWLSRSKSHCPLSASQSCSAGPPAETIREPSGLNEQAATRSRASRIMTACPSRNGVLVRSHGRTVRDSRSAASMRRTASSLHWRRLWSCCQVRSGRRWRL